MGARAATVCLIWSVVVNSGPAAEELTASFSVVKTLVSSDEFSAAFTLGQDIRDRSERDQALRFVAQAQFSAGDYGHAVTTAAYISDDSSRDRELRRMAEHAVKSNRGSPGGGAQADFDTLIELIQSTVQPDAWEELGGAGTVAGFPGGVLVDTSGLLSRVEPSQAGEITTTLPLETLQLVRQTPVERDLNRRSETRMVSLRRLERQLQRLTALGLPAERDMRNLAGLFRVDYVALIQQGTPEADIVLIGPAGPSTTDAEQRLVNLETGRPVLQLDDLVVLLRNAVHGGGVFGCSITPRQANLASAQKYLDETSRKPLQPRQRETWLASLREQLGDQDITVHGIDPASHTAHVIVEADYRMKLVGMGIEDGVAGVESYLDRVKVQPDGTVTPMTVLRWWFAVTDEKVRTNPDRDVFALPKQSLQVLSENELLTRTGQRVHTGESDELNSKFANDFSQHFTELATEYPIYAELRNIFDLALVAAVIQGEELPAKIGWQMTYFVGQRQPRWLSYRPAARAAPRTVETVISHRILNRKHIVAGVSGGVLFQGKQTPTKGLDAGAVSHYAALTQPQDINAWWWD